MASCFPPGHRLQAVAELMMGFCDIAKTWKGGLRVQPVWQKLCVCVWKEVRGKKRTKAYFSSQYDGVIQNMKSDPASSRAATTPQTSCMQKCRNSQGNNQPTAQVCDHVSSNALWGALVRGGEAPGPTVGQSLNFHGLLDGGI